MKGQLSRLTEERRSTLNVGDAIPWNGALDRMEKGRWTPASVSLFLAADAM